MPHLYNSTIQATAASVVELHDDNSTFEGFAILVAVMFALLIGICAFYLTCCGNSEHDRKMYAINHPEETRQAIEDIGLM